MSGSLAERTQLPAYFIFSFFCTGFVYPVVVSWVWGGGWLQARGFVDFAGSGAVHLIGGTAGLVGAAIVGPRFGMEKDPSKRKDVFSNPEYIEMKKELGDSFGFEKWIKERIEEPFTPYSYSFVVIGTFILWVSWIFFNGGSTYSMFKPRDIGTCKIMMNTLIAGAAGGCVATALKPTVMGTSTPKSRYDVGALCNGILAGLVGVTAGCGNIQPWAGFIIGLLSGLFYVLGCKLMKKIGVDDPVDASSVHGICGAWGLIATGFFDNSKGLFSGNKKEMGPFFGYQCLGCFCIIVWTASICGAFFLIFKKLGYLRVTLMEEIIGLDISEMGVEEPKEFRMVEAEF